MSSQASGLEEVDLSDLIGEIYDCVIDPSRWDPTLDRLRELLSCAGCALFVTDLRDATARMQSIVGLEKEWAAQFPEYSAEAAAMMSSVPNLMGRGLDEPVVGRRDIPEEVFLSSRYWREWAAPHGIVDFITLNLMRSPGRVAGIALGRHETSGIITEREVRLMRLLAPHLRRAVVISDLIDMKGIEAEALGRTLDAVPAGVVLVAEDAEILHTNRTADRMLAEAAPIQSVGGRLSAADSRTAGALRAVVAAAARNESKIAGAGIGMALSGHDGPPASAHVLPIAVGDLRSRLLPRGAAAVFVSADGVRPPVSLAPMTALYDLSGAETRLLEQLMEGKSLAEAASALFISQNTAKTHLSHIFAKTGTKRQAGLVALIYRLLPPVAPPEDKGGG